MHTIVHYSCVYRTYTTRVYIICTYTVHVDARVYGVDERVSLCTVGSHDKQLSPTFSIRAEENFNCHSIAYAAVLYIQRYNTSYNGFHRDELRTKKKKKWMRDARLYGYSTVGA